MSSQFRGKISVFIRFDYIAVDICAVKIERFDAITLLYTRRNTTGSGEQLVGN